MDGLAVERNPLDEGLDDEVQYLDNDGMEEWVGTNEDPEFFEPQSDEKWKKRKKKKRKKFESRFNLDPGAPNDHSTLVRPVEPHEMGEVNEYRRYMRKHYPETQIYVIPPTRRKPGALHDDTEDSEEAPDHCAIDMEGGSESNSEDEWEESEASGLEDMDDPAQEVALPELTYCQQAKADFKQWWREVKEAIFPRPTTPLENYEWYDSRKGWFMWRGNCKCPMRSMVKRGERPLCTPERERRFRQAWWDVRYPHLNRPAPPLLRLVRWLSARPPTREEQLEAWIKQINIERVDEAIAMGAKYREDMRYSGNICYYPNAPKHCRPGYKGKTRAAGAGGKKRKRRVFTLQDRLDKYGWYRMMGCHWFYIFVIVLGLLSTAFVFTGYGLNAALEAVGLARNSSTVVTVNPGDHFIELGDVNEICSSRPGDVSFNFQAYVIGSWGYEVSCRHPKCVAIAKHWTINRNLQIVRLNAPVCAAVPEDVACVKNEDRVPRERWTEAERAPYYEITSFATIYSDKEFLFFPQGNEIYQSDIRNGSIFQTSIKETMNKEVTHVALGLDDDCFAFVYERKEVWSSRLTQTEPKTLDRSTFQLLHMFDLVCDVHVDPQVSQVVVAHVRGGECLVSFLNPNNPNAITTVRASNNLPCTIADCNNNHFDVVTSANVAVATVNRAMYVFANIKAMDRGADFTVEISFTKVFERTVRDYGIQNAAIICLTQAVAGEDLFESDPKELRPVVGDDEEGDAWYEYHTVRLETHKGLARYFT